MMSSTFETEQQLMRGFKNFSRGSCLVALEAFVCIGIIIVPVELFELFSAEESYVVRT